MAKADRFKPPKDFRRRYGPPLKVQRSSSGSVICVHSTFHTEVLIIESSGKLYPVAINEELLDALNGEAEEYDAYLAVDSDGELFILPIKKEGDGMRKALEAAKGKWKEIQWNASTKRYDAHEPAEQLEEPTWPFEKFESVYLPAFEAVAIEDLNHKVVKRILKNREK